MGVRKVAETENARVRRAKPLATPSESEVLGPRDDIVTAATDIIAGEGIHRLSLGRIEARLGMSRGQLTYYFPTKESILLAVFDRMLQRMIGELVADAAKSGLGPPGSGQPGTVLERTMFGLQRLFTRPEGGKAELASLVHTFQAQIRHRPDFQAKLAAVNAGWRRMIVADLEAMGDSGPLVEAKASLIMAVFGGLRDQLAVDPAAFDRAALLEAGRQLFQPFVGTNAEAQS